VITGPLLRARCTVDEVRPSLVDPESERYREATQALIDITQAAAERQLSRGELSTAIEQDIVGNRVDHKLLRGLARVLTDRCEFDTRAPLPPPELRERLFAHGPVCRRADPIAQQPTAADVVAALAAELGCTPLEVERGTFADLKDNQALLACPPITVDQLLHRYNIALVQGLLLQARQVRIQLPQPQPKHLRQLFRHIKFQQLMYRIEPELQGYTITLDGPASLFGLSTRYGMALARFFPALPLQPGPWTMVAELSYRRRTRPMRITHEHGLRSHLPSTGTWQSREEQWLEEQWAKLDTPWVMEPGSEPLNLGGHAVVVPDLTFRCGDRVAHLEVVGVWRKAYLAKRLELLAEHGHPNLILAVNRKLLGDKGAAPKDLGAAVLPFSSAIPARKVLKLVEALATPG
jgi:predicted nuclease of restriction endonuclease-like RecB superfamily